MVSIFGVWYPEWYPGSCAAGHDKLLGCRRTRKCFDLQMAGSAWRQSCVLLHPSTRDDRAEYFVPIDLV